MTDQQLDKIMLSLQASFIRFAEAQENVSLLVAEVRRLQADLEEMHDFLTKAKLPEP